MRIVDFPMLKPKMLPVRMLRNAEGCLFGRFTMLCAKGKIYKIDESLAKIFFDLTWASLARPKADDDVYVLGFSKANNSPIWIKEDKENKL